MIDDNHLYPAVFNYIYIFDHPREERFMDSLRKLLSSWYAVSCLYFPKCFQQLSTSWQ